MTELAKLTLFEVLVSWIFLARVNAFEKEIPVTRVAIAVKESDQRSVATGPHRTRHVFFWKTGG